MTDLHPGCYRADNIRIDFVANASHELKTPITALQGMIETIINSPKMLKKLAMNSCLKCPAKQIV
ncbi:MAG: hypothetical protein CMQ11_10980 [Gammaproteobacteria bacterium]|nr:hypothetical protein [Gammaproteobacteria bacterium]